MTKLCECGCGQPAPIAMKSDPGRGYIKGEPTRFVLNHHKRVQPLKNYGFTKCCNGKRWYVVHRKGKSHTLWSRIVYQNYYLNGEEIPKGYNVHHKDENPENDVPENLELWTRGDHALHHRGKGIVLEKGTEQLRFPSTSQAGLYLGVTDTAMSWGEKNGREIEGWKITYTTKVDLPFGMFSHSKDGKAEYISLNTLKDKEKRIWAKGKKKTILQNKNDILEFSSCCKAAKYLDVSSMTISYAARNKTRVKGWEVCYKQ